MLSGHLLCESYSFGLAYVLFVFSLIVILVISYFGFESGTLILNASVPGHCLPFTYALIHSKDNLFHDNFQLRSQTRQGIFETRSLLFSHMLKQRCRSAVR